jgi:hypothetical protein
MKHVLIAEKMNYLINYAKNQFNDSKGLHLNSADWKSFITLGTPLYYSFLINGIIKYNTKSSISGKRYEQIIKLSDYKKMEAPLLLLFLLETDEQTIIDYISLFLTVSEAKLYCPCDAFSYWGSHYNLSELNSIYGPPEIRFPKIRDPKNNNIVCKHLWIVLSNYPKQIHDFAKNMIPYYKRYFGITSPTGIERTKKQLGIKGLKQVVMQGTKDLNKLGNKELLDIYNKLTEGKLNEIYNKEQNEKLKLEEDKRNEQLEKERLEQEKIEQQEKLKQEEMKKQEELERTKLEKEEQQEKERLEQERLEAEKKDYDSVMNKTIYNDKSNVITEIKPSDLEKINI